MEENTPLDAFHAHEVLHVASIVAQLFDQHIADHRFTQTDPGLKDAAQAISEQLHAFYQRVGERVLDGANSPCPPLGDPHHPSGDVRMTNGAHFEPRSSKVNG